MMAETALEKLCAARSQVSALISEHDQAAVRFRQNAAIGDIVVSIGVQWLEEELRVPGTESRKAAKKLRARWRESPEYRQLEAQTTQVTKDVRQLLREAFARPPSLREVHTAVMVPTKLKRLSAILDRAIERLESPAIAKSRKRRTRRPSPRTNSRLPAHTAESGKPWLQWLAAVAAFCTVMGLSYALSLIWVEPLIAVFLSLATSAAMILVLFLLSYWWTQRQGKAVATKSLPKRRLPSGKASRKRMRAYRELAYGDTTNWMPWEAKPRGASTEHFWRWWKNLHRVVEYLDKDDQEELLWLLEREAEGIPKENRSEFRRRFNALRKRARMKSTSVLSS